MKKNIFPEPISNLPETDSQYDRIIFSNNERMLLMVCFDNLASGTAVQTMNLHPGVDESLGLI